MKYSDLKSKWKNCSRCSHSSLRRNVVLLRGSIPCDLLFIGEAPGFNEDTIGYPFTGPAGHLLDKMLDSAFEGYEKPKIAYTHLVSCIPLTKNKNIKELTLESVENCRERLLETIELCAPARIITVGNLADEWLPNNLTQDRENINHPAYMLRLNRQQKSYAILRNIELIKNFYDIA